MQFQVFIFRICLTFIVDLAVIGLFFALTLPMPQTLANGSVIARRAANGKIFSYEVGPTNKNYVRLNNISRYLRASVIALEDARFYEHRGIDFEEVGNAVNTFFKGGRLRGASTITQQLAKNLYLSPERTFRRKFWEAVIAINIEAQLPKNKILELYLNSIEWGRGLMGIRQASYFYFKKRPSDLSLQESVFLAAIIPNPSRFGRINPNELPRRFVRRQMSRALETLFDQNLITLDQYQEALTRPLEFRP